MKFTKTELTAQLSATMNTLKATTSPAPKIRKDYGKPGPMAESYLMHLAERYARSTIKWLYIVGNGATLGCNERYLELWNGFHNLAENPESMDLVQEAAAALMEIFYRCYDFHALADWQARRAVCARIRAFLYAQNSRKRGFYWLHSMGEWDNEKGENVLIDEGARLSAMFRENDSALDSYLADVCRGDILTATEKKVFALMAKGYGVNDIARKRNVTIRAVEKTTKRIREKLHDCLWDEYLRTMPETDFDAWTDARTRSSAEKLWKDTGAEYKR